MFKRLIFITMAAIMASCGTKAPQYPSDTIETADGKTITITFFAHSSLMFEYDGLRIYSDPVEENAEYASLPAADFILVSHEHHDHCDPAAIARICTPSTGIVTNAASAPQLAGLKAQPNVMVMSNGDVVTLAEGVTLEAVPAYNYTEGRTGFHPAGRDNGFILTLGGTRIYIAGDTEDTPEMLALKDIYVAFLPVNQPYTMTEEQAANAVRALQPAIFYPFHFGQVDHRTDLEKLGRLIGDLPTEMRVRPLE